MASDVQWGPAIYPEMGLERLRAFSDPRASIVVNPNETHLQDFAAVIENVIVPRLLMTHTKAQAEPVEKRSLGLGGAVADFIKCTMADSPDRAVEYVRELLDDGVPFQNILLDLMAPAARELGERWVHDQMSFVEVTLGVSRMHRILREFDGVPANMWSQAGSGRHALLLPTPGENHTFGLRLVQEFLLRESWSVANHPVKTLEDLEDVVSSNHFDVVGVSLSGDTLIETFVSAISRIRSKSRNRHVKIIVGGQIFAERPELIESCGADAFGADAPSSVAIANGWVRELAAVN
jgi:MerR family transcriptional regulator, light-induced transcriptional regulator